MNQLAEKISFIGAGNMASAIIGGLLKNNWPSHLISASAKTEKTRKHIKKSYSINVFDNNINAIQQSSIIILSVKPNVIESIAKEITHFINQKKPLIISLAAGIEIKHFNHWFSTKSHKIIRCMPNTPSSIGFGMSGLFANSNVNNQDRALTEKIFNSIGETIWLKNESMINSVIAVSGSGPAYYYLMMEAMIETGIELGFDYETAKSLTIQTAIGASELAKFNSSLKIEELRKQVTSPKGTTERAIQNLENGHFKLLISKAMKAAVKRAQEIAYQ